MVGGGDSNRGLSCRPPLGHSFKAAGPERAPEDTREHGSQTCTRQTRPASSVQLSNWGISFQACARIQGNLWGLWGVFMPRPSTCWCIPL